MITGIIRNARKHVQVRAEQFAETYKDDTVIYTMGSGAGYGGCIYGKYLHFHGNAVA